MKEHKGERNSLFHMLTGKRRTDSCRVEGILQNRRGKEYPRKKKKRISTTKGDMGLGSQKIVRDEVGTEELTKPLEYHRTCD